MIYSCTVHLQHSSYYRSRCPPPPQLRGDVFILVLSALSPQQPEPYTLLMCVHIINTMPSTSADFATSSPATCQESKDTKEYTQGISLFCADFVSEPSRIRVTLRSTKGATLVNIPMFAMRATIKLFAESASLNIERTFMDCPSRWL